MGLGRLWLTDQRPGFSRTSHDQFGPGAQAARRRIFECASTTGHGKVSFRFDSVVVKDRASDVRTPDPSITFLEIRIKRLRIIRSRPTPC